MPRLELVLEWQVAPVGPVGPQARAQARLCGQISFLLWLLFTPCFCTGDLAGENVGPSTGLTRALGRAHLRHQAETAQPPHVPPHAAHMPAGCCQPLLRGCPRLGGKKFCGNVPSRTRGGSGVHGSHMGCWPGRGRVDELPDIPEPPARVSPSTPGALPESSFTLAFWGAQGLPPNVQC